MSGFTHFANVGFFPLQDHAAGQDGTPVDGRMMMAGGRVTKFKPTGEANNGQDSLLEYGKEHGMGTLGDLHPYMFWQTRERSARGMGSWSQVFGTVATDSDGYYGNVDVQPLRDHRFVNDTRYRELRPSWPVGLSHVPRGALLTVLPGTEESGQYANALWTDPRLIAPNTSGPGACGTLVVDLQPTSEICMDERDTPGIGGRHARLQSLIRVIAVEPGQTFADMQGAEGNTLALNFTTSGADGIPNYGAFFAAADGSAGPSGPITGGPSNNPTTGGPITGVPSGGTDSRSQLGNLSHGSGSFGGGVDLGGEDEREPKQFGSFQQSKEAGHALALMAALPAEGPLHPGSLADKHRHGHDRDGHPINAAHISTRAFYYQDAERDAPMEFFGDYPSPDPLPMQARAWCSYHAQKIHTFRGGARTGMWRFWAESPDVQPTTGEPDPPVTGQPPGTPTGQPPGIPTSPPTTAPPTGTPTAPPTGGGRKTTPGGGGQGGPTTGGGSGGPTTGGGTPSGPTTGQPQGSIPCKTTPAPPTGGGGHGGPGGPYPWPGQTPPPGSTGGSSTPGPTTGAPGAAAGGAVGAGVTGPITGGAGPRAGRGKAGSSGRRPKPPGGAWPITGRGSEGGRTLPWQQQGSALGPSSQAMLRTGGGELVPKSAGHTGRSYGGAPYKDGRFEFDRLSGQDPITREPQVLPGVAERIGTVEGQRRLYTLFRPMAQGFAALNFRPQLTVAGYPNFEHNPQMPAGRYAADERTRPQVLAVHAWGAQLENEAEWDYAENPEESRARGGTGDGGIVFHPPRFELEDYYDVGPAPLDTTDTTSDQATTGYVVAAPGVCFALGEPTHTGALKANAVTMAQDATTEGLKVEHNGTEAMHVYEADAGDVRVELGQGDRSSTVLLPKGTTAQRPSSAEEGMFRYNTTTQYPEFYDGSSWVSLNPSP